MIKVHDVTYAYESGKALRFPDFNLDRGEHALMLGDSGSGKTTLLHLIGGLLRPQTGSIQIEGTEITSLSESASDRFRGQHIGFIFQKNHLISSLTIRENLALSFFLSGLQEDDARIKEVLALLALTEYKDSKITALSQGQLQRAAIARSVLNNPALILADEPTSALDDKNCERVIHLLETVAETCNSTLVIATHDQRLKSNFRNHITLTGNIAAL
jgi:ABC-type lipoprotein export system ATPase subunit